MKKGDDVGNNARVSNRFFSQGNVLITREELEKEPLRVVSELVTYLAEKEKTEEGIPLSIFDNERLTVFEAVIKFLREGKKLTYGQIGALLGREVTTISTTYCRAKIKMKEGLVGEGGAIIPFDAFRKNKTYSPLEAVVHYLHIEKKYPFKDIARALNRDKRTIWTIYQRAKKK